MAVEAHIHFARRAARKALRTWALGEDRRPMIRKLRAAANHWGQRARAEAWTVWSEHRASGSSLHQRVARQLRLWRSDKLRVAWLAWRLERMRGVRDRLRETMQSRLQSRTKIALVRWSETLHQERTDLEAALLLTRIFRRECPPIEPALPPLPRL